MKKLSTLGLFLAVILCIRSACHSDEKKSPSFQKPYTSSIEKSLLDHIHKERESRELSPLKISMELTILARRHSQDMASLSRLSHFSTSGKSYLERLVAEALYFADIGENVAFSETFRADIIHQSLMESQEHRRNILTPSFDLVGIDILFGKSPQFPRGTF